MSETATKNHSPKKLGVLVGGSGLIGGYVTHYFKTRTQNDIELRAPNSKKLSLRELDDIKGYFRRIKPDFVINAAIAAIDSDAELAFHVNYQGPVNLARAALALKIPFIHISSAATLPAGENLSEEDHLPLDTNLSNYAKSKLMAEMTLKQMHADQGLDCTIMRMAVVYGEHDHKIQGINRLIFSLAEESMPFMLTRKGVKHSYSNANKVPYFIHHILENRREFSGQIYNFVDREPVEMANLILTLKAYMNARLPKEIYVPYHLAKGGKHIMAWMFRVLSRIGVKGRLPAELMFLENLYHTQTLSADKLLRSSFRDPAPEATVFTELPNLIQYYLTRWEHLNLISLADKNFFTPLQKDTEMFLKQPRRLLENVHRHGSGPLPDIR